MCTTASRETIAWLDSHSGFIKSQLKVLFFSILHSKIVKNLNGTLRRPLIQSICLHAAERERLLHQNCSSRWTDLSWSSIIYFVVSFGLILFRNARFISSTSSACVIYESVFDWMNRPFSLASTWISQITSLKFPGICNELGV